MTKKSPTKKCYLCKGTTSTLYSIKDATLNPKKYNGKKICAECRQYRILLKKEPV